jgi:hypothetical protein
MEGDIAKGHDGQALRMESWMVYRGDPLAMRQLRQCLGDGHSPVRLKVNMPPWQPRRGQLEDRTVTASTE